MGNAEPARLKTKPIAISSVMYASATLTFAQSGKRLKRKPNATDEHITRIQCTTTMLLHIGAMEEDTMPTDHERLMTKFDEYVAEMRDAGCVVIAYTPDDVRKAISYQLGTRSDEEFEFHPLVDLIEVAKDTHEDDTLWDALSESIAWMYSRSLEAALEYEADEQAEEEVI